jgi:hypothetical protein
VEAQYSAELIVGSLSSKQLGQIDEIGTALFKGQPIRVGHRGLVFPKPQFVTQVVEEYQDGQSKGSRRPAAGSRQGRQGPSRPRYPDSADLLRWAVGNEDQFVELKRNYPEARITVRADGHWLAVRAHPLGPCGPQVLFLSAVPADGRAPASWGFWANLPEPIWIGPRHTNFGNGLGSICAFPLESQHLECEFPLIRYFDLLAEWSARHLYLATRRIWPGPQEGRWLRYRLTETLPGECCPFPSCFSGRAYEDCCKPKDLVARAMGQSEADPSAGIERRPPPAVTSLARRRGANPPSFALIY